MWQHRKDKSGFSHTMHKYFNVKPENTDILKENIDLFNYDPDKKDS